MKYCFIAQHQQEYPVTTMCQVLEVSVSGYYAWKQRPASARQKADERLSARIRQVHEATHQIYGSRRIHAGLANQGSSCGRKRVVRLMRQHGLKARRWGIAPPRPIASTAIPSRPTSDGSGFQRTGAEQQVGDGYHRDVDCRGLTVCGRRTQSVLAPRDRLGESRSSGCGVG